MDTLLLGSCSSVGTRGRWLFWHSMTSERTAGMSVCCPSTHSDVPMQGGLGPGEDLHQQLPEERLCVRPQRRIWAQQEAARGAGSACRDSAPLPVCVAVCVCVLLSPDGVDLRPFRRLRSQRRVRRQPRATTVRSFEPPPFSPGSRVG